MVHALLISSVHDVHASLAASSHIGTRRCKKNLGQGDNAEGAIYVASASATEGPEDKPI